MNARMDAGDKIIGVLSIVAAVLLLATLVITGVLAFTDTPMPTWVTIRNIIGAVGGVLGMMWLVASGRNEKRKKQG